MYISENDINKYQGSEEKNKKGQDLHEDIDDGKSVFPVRVSCTEPEIQTSDRRNEPQPFPDADMPSFFFEHEDVDCPEDEIKPMEMYRGSLKPSGRYKLPCGLAKTIAMNGIRGMSLTVRYLAFRSSSI